MFIAQPEQLEGMVADIAAIFIAPAVVSPLPLKVALVFKLIAPFDTIVPINEELSPKVNAPFVVEGL